jgi:hypothetical protein
MRHSKPTTGQLHAVFNPLGFPTMKHGSSVPIVVCEGWVLKKRRKKMQGVCMRHAQSDQTDPFPGFARRYFVLYQTGLLQYSFGPEQPVRDQISLQHAAVSTAPGRKDIHIDSNTATFHIKCLSTEDFNVWMTALRSTPSKQHAFYHVYQPPNRKIISLGHEARRSLSSRKSVRQTSIGLTKSEGLIEGMAPVRELYLIGALD